ncbi:hypothetical protein I5Q34_11800 [Streptomyces sp. AV19]|uniref:hypothetical protein n=1 Tax=Streptomyces sp. AV19 TaxID=2793068 RepID=UPI0018FE56C3|nr:hypothetical protein [Streptomyces sp. AV19]MBH1934950.1 hypothetical protein [Streptomyces sp. AV19]MDG4534555.1 hypothetical protein [Streptomyces sp. AV19]
MPRGRHRHSTSLHRLLPPSLVAATSVACAAGAWTVGEPLVIRGLAAGAAAAAVVGSVLMRRWDRSAGKQVAQLTAARSRDEWKTDERLAELETDLEETRQARTRLEAKLRGKRAELARLRTEHADLLRRYATAETERASALEGRRVLESAAGGASSVGGAEGDASASVEVERPRVAKALESAMQARAERRVGPEAYRKAADALRNLERNGAAQRGDGGDDGVTSAEVAVVPVAAARVAAAAAVVPAVAPAASAEVVPAARPALPAGPLPVRQPAVPAVRQQGGFDFFGNAKARVKPASASVPVPESGLEPKPESKPVEEQDLADVVGEEALAERVIDLTAHDETEQIDVAELRSAI